MAFTMRSSNKPAGFKMMGSSSPVRKDKDKDNKFTTYKTTQDNVTGNMTDEELRKMAVDQHEGTSGKWNVSFNQLKKLRNAKKPKEVKTDIADNKEPVIPPSTLQEQRKDFFRDEEASTTTSQISLNEVAGGDISEDRELELRKSQKSGYINKLRDAVEDKYGMRLDQIEDPEDRQKAEDAMIDPKTGELLPMSSAAGVLYKKAPKGYTMKRKRK